MRIIYFEENQKNQWNKFIAENCSESFLQSWEWGNFQESLRRKIWRIGIIDDNLSNEDKTSKSQILNSKSQTNPKSQLPITNYKLLAIALIVKYNLPFGKSYLYCPRGPAVEKSKIKNQKSKILNLLINEIRKIAEKEKAMFLRIDPATPLTPTLSRGEREKWIKKSPNEIQPRDTLMLDLTKSEEELLKEMKQKTRYNIRLAEKKGIKITNLEYRILNLENFKKGLDKFWELIEETSARDKFASHNKNYYWKMLESLSFVKSEKNCHSEFISESIGNKGLSRFQFIGQDLEKIVKSDGNRQKILKQVQNDSCSCNQKLQAKLYLAEYENKIIAANIVLYFGDLAVYLHGASSGEYRNVMAPYLLQWRQILDAKKAGCKRYDFWGVSATKAAFANAAFRLRSVNKNNSWSGITRFKKGFGGEEKNYIGAYDAVFDNIGYAAYRFIKFVKLKVYKVIK